MTIEYMHGKTWKAVKKEIIKSLKMMICETVTII